MHLFATHLYWCALPVVLMPLGRAVIQVLSRLWALWGLVAVAPEACSTGAVTLLSAGPLKLQLSYVTLMLCWSISEILRYGFYACKARLLQGSAVCPKG